MNRDERWDGGGVSLRPNGCVMHAVTHYLTTRLKSAYTLDKPTRPELPRNTQTSKFWQFGHEQIRVFHGQAQGCGIKLVMRAASLLPARHCASTCSTGSPFEQGYC